MTPSHSFQLTAQCHNYMAGISMSPPQCCLAMDSSYKRRQRRPVCTCRIYTALWQQCCEGTRPSLMQLAHLCHSPRSSSDCHLDALLRWSTSFQMRSLRATPPRCLYLSALVWRRRLKTKRERSMRQAGASTDTQGNVAEDLGPVGPGYVHSAWQQASSPDEMGNEYRAGCPAHIQPEQLC